MLPYAKSWIPAVFINDYIQAMWGGCDTQASNIHSGTPDILTKATSLVIRHMYNAGAHLREFDWENHCLLERILGLFQTRHILPVHVGFLCDNGTAELTSHLCFLSIYVSALEQAVVVGGGAGSMCGQAGQHHVSVHASQ